MTAYNFGDVVLVPFPFTDQTTTKQRPAVVISSDAYHRAKPDVILMAVTSQLRPTTGVGEAIVQDWKGAGLLKPSVIKSVITTIERGLIIKRLGRLKEEDRNALKRVIGAVIG
jgi:mRNA interferase MazF